MNVNDPTSNAPSIPQEWLILPFREPEEASEARYSFSRVAFDCPQSSPSQSTLFIREVQERTFALPCVVNEPVATEIIYSEFNS